MKQIYFILGIQMFQMFSLCNIIGFIKKHRLNWLGPVERMTEDNIMRKIKLLVPELFFLILVHPVHKM